MKAIFKLSEKNPKKVSTNNIAAEMETTPASVSDMLKKLAEKGLIHYKKYKGVELTDEGRGIAVRLIRRHRLWEVFLVDKLHFTWDQVHEIAEEMEHIKSPLLTARLEQFLGFPTHDPHGDPIPDAEGNIDYHEEVKLSELAVGDRGVIVNVDDQSTEFLQYLDKIDLNLQKQIEVVEYNEYDNSRTVQVDGKRVFVSEKVSTNLLVKRL